MKAQYLLRFDDICPGMNWRTWNEVEKILCDEEIRPLLAVVPDNRDEKLQVAPVNERFWDQVQVWQERGWTIAMHGWQHRYVTKDAGILGINKYSEFAGLSRAEQQEKIRSGLEVFRREGIGSAVWVAPAHSFDAVTVQVLSEAGFGYISDGVFLFPHVDDVGMTWIPQQLWSFRWRPFGVWTICFHANSWGGREVSAFRNNVRKYREKISNFDVIAKRYGGRKKRVIDSVAGETYRSVATVITTAKQLTRPFRMKLTA